MAGFSLFIQYLSWVNLVSLSLVLTRSTRATIATHANVLANHDVYMYAVYIPKIVPLTQIPVVLHS